ncbi:MAG: tetratricopeptide repeat protein [Candidatus Leucobacter sulfamidivorax]|nr:tetratricopeptide repeat protein [Candidatus Leucobacter sulfamidivorax]
MEERQIKVPTDIANAMNAVLGHIPDRPTAMVLLALYLFDVAKDFGLSGHGRDPDRIEGITRAHPAKELIKALLPGEADGAGIEEDLADLLHSALLVVSDDDTARKLIDKTSPPDATDTRKIGQVYWNLFPAPGRENLHIPPNTPPPGSARAEAKIYEAMSWNERKTAGVKLYKGPVIRENPFRQKGARIAVLLAQHLASSHEGLEQEAINASFDYSEDGKVAAIRWHEPTTAEVQSSQFEGSSSRKTDEVDTLRSLAQDGVKHGKHADAADMLEVAVKILRRRSEEEIGDHELRLALVSLEAGLASMNAGRSDEAVDHFQNVEKGILMLSDLSPDSVEHDLELAVALIGQGAGYVQSGRFDLAAEALARAVIASQSLADQDSDAEIILALALFSLGSVYLGAEHFAEATSSLARAETILRKLGRRDPADNLVQFALATTLLALGQTHLSSEYEREARTKFTEALRISTTLSEEERFKCEGRLLQATAMCMLALADFALAQEQDDDHALDQQMSQIEAKLTKAVLMFEELRNDGRAAELLIVIEEFRRNILDSSSELAEE